MRRAFGLVSAAAVAAGLWSERAEACGCFAPPDPTVPVVQAGERILFAMNNGVVTAHIQLQYAGEAGEFGWLLPLPSVPTLKLGTEELFTQLIATTQPRYFVTVSTTGNCGRSLFGFGSVPTAASAGGSFEDANGGSPVVLQSSIGPYDYAVLHADDKDEMLSWLRDNRYFIPVGTENVVGPYINPGAYFLALKLRSGQSAGDIQPVVLEYPAALPMIPIVLTSVAAQPNMGIQVWMLGEGRAIPRNYAHVVINDSQLDWLNSASNYSSVVTRAVGEAPGKHAFVTEYAGTSSLMHNVLDPVGRFGTLAELSAQSTPGAFVQYLLTHGFTPISGNAGVGPVVVTLLAPVKRLLLAALPLPPLVAAQGVTEDEWLNQLDLFLGSYRAQNPSRFEGYTYTFNPAALAQEIDEKIVKPTTQAGALFKRFSTLTRLYTTLSPEDMSKDPVFSFNPSLPDVSRDHTAKYEVSCGISGSASTSPARLVTEQGWVVGFPAGRNGAADTTFKSAPAALRIETLAEEGEPTITQDNQVPIARLQGCSGCTSVDPVSLGLFAVLAARWRRRQN